MKKPILFATLAVVLSSFLFFSSCSKKEDEGTDLTTGFTGDYSGVILIDSITGSATATWIPSYHMMVTKVDNNHIHIANSTDNKMVEFDAKIEGITNGIGTLTIPSFTAMLGGTSKTFAGETNCSISSLSGVVILHYSIKSTTNNVQAYTGQL